MKRNLLFFVHFAVVILLTPPILAQVPAYQRLAIPPGEFKLTASEPVVEIRAYCVDGDILVESSPSPHYTKILSDPQNMTVQVGNHAGISMQQAIEQGVLQVTVLENLMIEIKKNTAQPVSFSVRKNGIFGTEMINKDLHIGTLPVARDGQEYAANQRVIWRQRALQKQGFKKDPVDGIALHDAEALARFQASIGVSEANDPGSELTRIALDNWENTFDRVTPSIYFSVYYPDLREQNLTNIGKGFVRFAEDAKLRPADIKNGGSAYVIDQIKQFDNVRFNINGSMATLPVRKAGKNWQVLLDADLLTIEKIPGAGLGLKVLKRELPSLDQIHGIQKESRAFFSTHQPEGYNVINLGPIEGGTMDVYCNGQTHRIELKSTDDGPALYEKIRQTVGNDWKTKEPILIAGDLFENSGVPYRTIEQKDLSWLGAHKFASELREYGKQPVNYVRDMEAFLKITPENKFLQESFLRFPELKDLPYDVGLVDLRSQGTTAQAVLERKGHLTRLIQSERKVDIGATRKAMTRYAAGLLSMDELITQTKDYADMLEEIQKQAGTNKLVTMEHDELDAAQLWALHDKGNQVQFYRDEPDLDQSLRNVKTGIKAQTIRSCILVSCPLDKASMERLKVLSADGIRVIFNDSLRYFRKVLRDSVYSQLSWVTSIKGGEFRFADGTLSYARMHERLAEINYPKDYLHIICNPEDSLMQHFAASGKFKRVWMTAYDPQDSLSKQTAIAILPEIFRNFSPAVSYLGEDAFMFEPESRGALKKILGLNDVTLKDGRVRIQLNKVTLKQWKQIEKLYLYDNLIRGSVLPKRNNKPVNLEMDDIFNDVGRERIREFKGLKDKRNYLLGVPRLKVCLPPKKKITIT